MSGIADIAMADDAAEPGQFDISASGKSLAHNINIRPANSGDLAALLALETICFPDDAWDADSWRAELEGGGRLVLVAEARRVVSGNGCEAYGDIVAAACFHIAGDSAELYTIATLPDWRGLGLATLLLARGFDWAAGQGAAEMFLEVRLGNGAQALYADAGFHPLYERTNYYGPGLHALVMRKELKESGAGDE